MRLSFTSGKADSPFKKVRKRVRGGEVGEGAKNERKGNHSLDL